MYVLGLDFETTSLDIQKARIIEIGAVLFDVVDGEWNHAASYSSLVYDIGDDALAPETVKVTGITDADLQRDGRALIPSIKDLLAISKEAEMVVCHNAQYDNGVLVANTKKRDIDVHVPEVNLLLSLPWICSVMDIKSNRNYKCRTLSHMALDTGLAIDPSKLHRAIEDVRLMGAMLNERRIDPKEMLEYQSSPWVYLQAIIVPPWEDGGNQKDAASKLGYSWEKARGTTEPVFSKTWVKRVKESDVEDERKAAQFPVKIIQA